MHRPFQPSPAAVNASLPLEGKVPPRGADEVVPRKRTVLPNPRPLPSTQAFPLRGRWREAPDEVAPRKCTALSSLRPLPSTQAFPLRGRWREAPDEVVPRKCIALSSLPPAAVNASLPLEGKVPPKGADEVAYRF